MPDTPCLARHLKKSVTVSVREGQAVAAKMDIRQLLRGVFIVGTVIDPLGLTGYRSHICELRADSVRCMLHTTGIGLLHAVPLTFKW